MKLPIFLLISFVFMVSCSMLGDRQRVQCRGEFLFSGISAPGLRDDAHDLIVEFAALDEHVEIEPGQVNDGGSLIIRGIENQCTQFANSFLSSDMHEFQGLRYQPR